MLPKEVTEDVSRDKEVIQTAGTSGIGEIMGGNDRNEGLDWFETMVEGSRLGRTNTRRHSAQTGPGWKIEWEIVEWVDGDDDDENTGKGNGKRKIGELEDVGMSGAQ